MTHLPGRPEHVGKDEVSICFAHSRNCRPLDAQDLTRMYIEGREQCDILWKFIKNNIPGFENCWLIDTAPLLGVREGRRVLGEYVLTGYDLASRARFDDVISISSHGYDVHGPEAPGNIKWAPMEIDGEIRPVVCAKFAAAATTLLPPEEMGPICDYKGRTGEDMEFPQPNYYDIPYRSLVPVDVENLLVAGRCLSSDFYAQSGSRLILCCMNMGEAAGVATALSLKHDVAPRQVDRVELQGTLIDRGVTES
jgi:hypothetical protein